MEKLLEDHEGRAADLVKHDDNEAVDYSLEIASLRQEIEQLKAAGRATAPPARLISLRDACELTSLSRTALNRWRGLGKFPLAVSLGDKRIAFVRAEIQQWVHDRIADRARAA